MNLPEGTVPRVMNLEVLDDLCATLVEVGPAEPQRAEVTFRKEASGKRKRICQALVQADVVSRMARDTSLKSSCTYSCAKRGMTA